jgi:hypothetical protein
VQELRAGGKALQHPAPWIGRFFADLERAELRNSTGGA